MRRYRGGGRKDDCADVPVARKDAGDCLWVLGTRIYNKGLMFM